MGKGTLSKELPCPWESIYFSKELLMAVQDVASLPSEASFSATFLKHCGRGESLGTTTCLRTVVGGKHRHASCKILLLQQHLFLCQSNFMEIIRLLWQIWPPSVLGMLPDLKQWCLSNWHIVFFT